MRRTTLIRLYAAGHLDPPTAAAFEARMDADPSLKDAVAAELARLAEPDDAPDWSMPPPGMGLAAHVALPCGLLGPESIRVGEAFEIRVHQLPDAAQRQVVLLRRSSESWDIVAPAPDEESIPLEAVPVTPDQEHRFDLVAISPAGAQRWAIALPLRGADPHDRATLMQGIRSGLVPVTALEVDVQA